MNRVAGSVYYLTSLYTTASGTFNVVSGFISTEGYPNKMIDLANLGTSNSIDYRIYGANNLSGGWFLFGSGRLVMTSATMVSNNTPWRYTDVQILPTSNTLQTTVLVNVVGSPF